MRIHLQTLIMLIGAALLTTGCAHQPTLHRASRPFIASDDTIPAAPLQIVNLSPNRMVPKREPVIVVSATAELAKPTLPPPVLLPPVLTELPTTELPAPESPMAEVSVAAAPVAEVPVAKLAEPVRDVAITPSLVEPMRRVPWVASESASRLNEIRQLQRPAVQKASQGKSQSTPRANAKRLKHPIGIKSPTTIHRVQTLTDSTPLATPSVSSGFVDFQRQNQRPMKIDVPPSMRNDSADWQTIHTQPLDAEIAVSS